MLVEYTTQNVFYEGLSLNPSIQECNLFNLAVAVTGIFNWGLRLIRVEFTENNNRVMSPLKNKLDGLKTLMEKEIFTTRELFNEIQISIFVTLEKITALAEERLLKRFVQEVVFQDAVQKSLAASYATATRVTADNTFLIVTSLE